MGKIIKEINIKKEENIKKDEAKNTKKKTNKKGIEELLVELRTKKGLSRLELLDKLDDTDLTEKDIKKWEVGLKYPDLDTIYKLSEIYMVPSEEIIQAKSNSYEKGLGGINKKIIKWFVYTLNISFYAGVVLTIILYMVTFIGALWFFVSVASQA